MNAKWLPISAAVFMALSSASAFAADDNGWEFHGYGRLGGQWNGNGASKMNTLAKNEYRTVTSMDENANQVELQAKKHTVVKGKVYGDFVTRAEYGNQNAGDTGYFVSSEGSLQTRRGDAQFELKEAYIEMGGFDFLGSDTKIWAGQRFLNRQQGLLTKEFWKQSSGVGAGVQVGQAGFAVVSADQAGQIRDGASFGDANANKTMTSFDAFYYGVQGGPLGGTFDFDLKYMKQANTDGDAAAETIYGNRTSGAEDGIGGAITYNRNYYGFKGWSSTAIAYGQGMASNRGVNFGSWNGGFGKDTDALFVTSYGVAEITPKFQLGSEVTYWAPNHVGWGDDSDVDVSRLIVALQPSYKINDNLRAIFTGSYADEGIDAANGKVQWGRSEKNTQFYALEAAVAFTVDSDYFGRPQIKPFVNWVNSGDAKAASAINIDKNKDGTTDQSEVFYGVEAEVWF
jgi:sucrose porin